MAELINDNWYKNWSVKDLRKKAHDLNIKKWYNMRKDDLIKSITDLKKELKVDVPPKLEMEKDAVSKLTDMAQEEPTNSPKRTVSWVILIGCVITIPLFAWWISQPDPWYQQVLDFFKF